MKPEKRRNEPSYRLTFEDAVEIHKMKAQGYIQSRIAAHFDVNQGRVNEVLNEKEFVGSLEEYQRRLQER